MCKRHYETKEETRGQQKAVEPLMNDSQEQYQLKGKNCRTARYEILSAFFLVRCVAEFLPRLSCYSEAVLLDLNICEPIGVGALCLNMDKKHINVEWCMGGRKNREYEK
jgi:hypothetical protein